MEAEIEKFLSGYGYGYGYGNGDEDEDGYGDGSGNGSGNGYGYGNGSGNGSGNGNGSGYGDGDGNGDGNGYGYVDGSGNGNGSGDGYGSGSGDGYGSGSGDGCGSGNGNGYGYGYGYGYGNGDGNGIKIKQFKGNKVYYVDDIPCIFKSVHENYASVEIIDVNSLELKNAFIGKFENRFAHGETIREAIEDARSKYYQSLDFDEVKEKLLSEFKEKGKLTVKELYNWHGILTGSCRFGRTQFQTEHNLKDDDLLSLEEFVELTKNAFGGDRILCLN